MSFFDSLRRMFERGAPRGGHTMIPCGEALRWVQEFLDGELADVPLREVRAHFDVCRRCYPHLRFERSFREAVLRAGSFEAAPLELKERLARMLADAGEEG